MNLFVWFLLACNLGLCLNTAIRKSTFLGGPMMDRGYWVERRCRSHNGVCIEVDDPCEGKVITGYGLCHGRFIKKCCAYF
ncbi:Hypothetical predicted protein [Mytilus galloprovincialis]|uniref:Uncharacterized protein n=1 Tax=Mytilus galloprovincialis TaxID=29158 RepID=A0A8B6C4B6_MYTGA|nr:Hypothetical predicted protein [Mytilus galloprovincialis]